MTSIRRPKRIRRASRVGRDGERPLTQASFARGLKLLTEGDARLAGILDSCGPPPMWTRDPGFSTLVYIILEQQVSLASAKAAYDRLRAVASPLVPERFISLTPRSLKQVGFSRQKMDYCRGIARSIVDGRLDLDALERMGDEEAKAELTAHRGIGRWTADIYLLQALRRPDVWPTTDLALAVAAKDVLMLEHRPASDELEELGENWRPWRAIAARLFWHHYLNTRGGSMS